MRNTLVIIIISVAFASLFSGCKQNNKYAERLQELAAQINAQPDKKLANGTILTKCEYNVGDSVFTYYIKVEDNRFDNVNTDSIKSSLYRRISSPQMKKLRNTLIKSNVGLQYVYDSASKQISIVFPPNELSDSIINVK